MTEQAAPPPRLSQAASIYAAQVRLLLKETTPVLVGNLGIAAIVALLLVGTFPNYILLGWMLALVAISAARFWLVQRFKRIKPA